MIEKDKYFGENKVHVNLRDIIKNNKKIFNTAKKPQKSGGCGGTFDCGSNQVEGPGNPSFENRTNNAREHVGSNKADEERLRYDNVNLHKDSSKKGENIDYGA